MRWRQRHGSECDVMKTIQRDSVPVLPSTTNRVAIMQDNARDSPAGIVAL